ncbi:MAG: hypothetical protein JXB32_12870, partial [Deltaproteobacteria bacterium]|nr:hypothetical protein [Deltaproteobacteria bacterium]
RYSRFAAPALDPEQEDQVRRALDYDGDGIACNPDASPPVEDPEDMEIERRVQLRANRNGYAEGSRADFESWCRLAAYDDPERTAEQEDLEKLPPARWYPSLDDVLSSRYDPTWADLKVRTSAVRDVSVDGAPVEPICLSGPGDADIDADGTAHGCLFVLVDDAVLVAGLRAHVPGFGDVCVPWQEPKHGTLEEEPSHERWSFDREGGVWHACPGGSVTAGLAPTVPIRCFVDDQCMELGPTTTDWRCLEGLCRPPVYCESTDDCAPGYVCREGGPWSIDRDVCQLPSACSSYVGGICAPEGACVGTVCEEMILGCPSAPGFVPGGGGCNSASGCTYESCGSNCLGEESHPYRGCRDRRPLQPSGHEYDCIETAAVTCTMSVGYCDPAREPGSYGPGVCPIGSTCRASASLAPWCGVRDLLFDEHAARIVGKQGGGDITDAALLLLARNLSRQENYPTFEMIDPLYQFLNDGAIRSMVENFLAATYVPDLTDTGVDFREKLFGPDFFWRGLEVAPGVPAQGELVVSMGQEESFDWTWRCGATGTIFDGPWRLQLALQPYYHAGALHWAVSRVIVVHPETGRDATHHATGCGSDCASETGEEISARVSRKVEGSAGGLEASVEPVATMLWRLVADEPLTAGLLFGNWDLLSALDRLHPVPGRVPPVTTDGVPDEVIGIRIEDGKALVRALERR